MRLILASASPRRAELLSAAGIAFDVVPADVDETPAPGEAPADYVRRLALAKAAAIVSCAPGRPVLAADTVVVASGTMLGKPRDAADARRMLALLSGARHEVMTGVCLAGVLFEREARGNGDRGSGIGDRGPGIGDRGSGIGDRGAGAGDRGSGAGDRGSGAGPDPIETAGLKPNAAMTPGAADVRVEVTAVEFAVLSAEEIDWYVGTSEPLDKAGAYAVQGLASRFVVRVEGSYSNVVGLPVALVYEMCRRAGLLLS